MLKRDIINWRNITVSFYIFIVVILLLIGFLSYRSFYSVLEKDFLVTHTYEVMATAENLMHEVETAETDQRGFLISGDSAYLETYKRLLDGIVKHQAELRRLTEDNQGQQERIKKLYEMIEARIAMLNQALLWKIEGDHENLNSYFEQKRGKKSKAKIESLLQEILDNERALLTERTAAQEESMEYFRNIVYCIILFAIVVSLILFIVFRQQMKLKDAYEKSLKEKNEELADANEALEKSREDLSRFNLELEQKVDQRTKDLQELNKQNLQLLQKEKASRREIEFIMNFITQLVWRTEPNGKPDYFNQRWFDFTGLDYIELKDNGWEKVLHPDDYEKSIRDWKFSLTTGEPFETECRVRRKDGIYRWFVGKALPMRDENGTIVSWLGTLANIHEYKKQEEKLLMQNERLNEMNQYMDNFVHAAAHDLRSPVANMQGLVELLRNGNDPFKSKAVLEMLFTSINRLDNTLQGMIRLVEMQSSPASQQETFMLKDVWSEVFLEHEHLLLSLDYEITTDFKDCLEVTSVKAYLSSIFRNLLNNAIKYRKEDQKLCISIRCIKEDGYTLVQFQDNGIGIDMTKHGKNMFKPFKRFTKQSEGKGIGLHLISCMVQKLAGKVEVESKVGEGTTFKLYFKENLFPQDEAVELV